MENIKHKLSYIFHCILAQEKTIVEHTQLAHWNVRDIHFFYLHKMFNEQYDEFFEEIDKIAETISILGYCVSQRQIQKYRETYYNTCELEDTEDPKSLIEILLKDHYRMLKLIEKAVQICENYPEYESEKNYLGELQGKHKKAIWFLTSSLK